MTHEQRAVRAVVVAEMDRGDRCSIRLLAELLAHEDVTREVEAELRGDPGERDENDERRRAQCASRSHGRRGANDVPARRAAATVRPAAMTTPSAGIALTQRASRSSWSTNHGIVAHSAIAGAADPPRRGRERRDSDESERDRDERDREVDEREPAAEPARDPLARDVVGLGRIDPA